MPVVPLHRGLVCDILAYEDARGEIPAQDFIEELQPSDQRKVIALLERTSDNGVPHNAEKFRQEDDKIYAFKSFQFRLLCFYLPKAPKITLVLTHGFIKKKDDMPPGQLERANRIYGELVK